MCTPLPLLDNIGVMLFIILSELLCDELCDTMFTVCSTLIWAVLTGPTDCICHIGTLTLCIDAVAWSCIIVTRWSGSDGIQAWSRWPTGFLQCFDTVGLVILPVKIVPEMTYNVSSATLSLYTTTRVFNTVDASCVICVYDISWYLSLSVCLFVCRKRWRIWTRTA